MIIIAAVDRTDRAGKVVREALEITRTFNDSVHVVHVLSQSEFVELKQTEYKKSGRPVIWIASGTMPRNSPRRRLAASMITMSSTPDSLETRPIKFWST